MTDTTSNKGAKGPKTLDDEIAAMEEKLKRLKAQKAEKERKELERNQKAIATFLRTERLDAIPVATWTKNLQQLRRILKAEPQKETGGDQANVTADAKSSAHLPAAENERKQHIEPVTAQGEKPPAEIAAAA